jgi:hypothetical protein
LESLHKSVISRPVTERIGQIAPQAGGLDSAKQRNTCMGNMNTPAPYSVNGEGRVSIPALKVKSPFLFASLSLQPGQPPGQFIAEHKQARRILAQNAMETLKGRIAGEQTPEYGFRQ